MLAKRKLFDGHVFGIYPKVKYWYAKRQKNQNAAENI